MKVLLVTAHPRQDSLTHQAAHAFASAAMVAGHQIEYADLVAEGFDPRMTPQDEPDWGDPKKSYSPAVQEEMARVERNDSTVMFFPVWWWSTPAVLKGWIDRVWNNGWAYGEPKYPHSRVWMVAIAGVNRAGYEKRGYDAAMQTQLKVGLLDFCGIPDTKLEIFYAALENAAAAQSIILQAQKLGTEF